MFCCRIIFSTHGRFAIDKVAANDYDIVFMDHMMPEIDGVDATKIIRAAGEGSNQPVIIALSANVMEEAKHLFTDAGMNDFVAKPIDVKDLITTIKKWLPPEKIVDYDGEIEETGTGDNTSTCADNNLPDMEELDFEAAIAALGSSGLYNKIAEEYYRSGEDKLKEIRKAYESEDWKDYTIKVHALKSSSRQIGAMELGSLAEALEKAGKADDIDTIRSDTEVALTMFEQLLEKLSPYYGSDEEDDVDKPLIEKGTLFSLLDELEENCDNLDLDGMEEVVNKLKEYSFEKGIDEDIVSLQKAVADIDTDECMEIIVRIRE